MAADKASPNSPHHARRRHLLLAGLLTVALAAGAIILHFTLGRIAPVPPEANGGDLEPGVKAAVQTVRDRVLKNPRSARAWGDLGQVFLANELEDESRPCFVEAQRLDPADPRWPYFRAGPLLNRGDLEAALPYLLRAVELGGEEDAAAASRLRLAETLLILGRLDESESHVRQVQALRPDDPRALFDMARLDAARQDWAGARARLAHCLGSPFTQLKARVQLAVACARLGDLEGADEFRAQADRLPPDADWFDPYVTDSLRWAVKKKSRYRLVDNLAAVGRIPEAIAVLRPMAAEFPDDYLPQLTLGQYLAQAGQYPEAELSLRLALRLAPDKVQAHYYLSLLLFKEGEERRSQGEAGRARAEALFGEAASLARQALAIKPDYGYAHMALGVSLKGLGRRTEAVTALREAVHCNPEFAELHLRLGETLAEDGQDAEARFSFEQALRLGAPDAPWRPDAAARLAALAQGGGPAPARP